MDFLSLLIMDLNFSKHTPTLLSVLYNVDFLKIQMTLNVFLKYFYAFKINYEGM